MLTTDVTESRFFRAVRAECMTTRRKSDNNYFCHAYAAERFCRIHNPMRSENLSYCRIFLNSANIVPIEFLNGMLLKKLFNICLNHLMKAIYLKIVKVRNLKNLLSGRI